jgi:hypothetical protein
MSVSYTFEERVLVVRAEGRYPAGALAAAVRAALNDPHRPAAAGLFAGLLLDLRDSLSLRERSTDEIRDTARALVALVQLFGSRLALVASADVDYGLLGVAAVAFEGAGVTPAVFRDVAAARAWLLD